MKPKPQTAEAFLTELSEAMKGLVTEEEREFLVSEQGFWLDRRIRDEVVLGLSYEEAEALVVGKNGNPLRLAKRLAFETFEDAVNSPVYNMLGRANVCANSVFGLMCGLYMLFTQWKVYLPTSTPLPLRMSPADAREIFPEPLPYPDMSWSFILTITLPLIAPLIGGWICGRLVPVGAARAVYHVVVIMALATFLMGLVLLPDKAALLFGGLLTVYWLPVGCLTAHFSSSFLRWQHCRQLERNGLQPPSPFTIQEMDSL